MRIAGKSGLWVLVLFAALVAACVRDAPLADAPCPCVSGYACCEATGRCVRTGAPCGEDATSDIPARAQDAQVGDATDGPPMPDAATDAPVPDARKLEDDPVAIDSLEPTEGPWEGGTTVTLGGRGLVAGARVWFGHREAAVLEADATRLRVRTPAGAPDVPAVTVVVDLGGRRLAATESFRYVLPTLVDVTDTAGLEGGRGVGLVVLDTNEDGLRDLVTARTAPGQVLRWRGLGGLRFAPDVDPAPLAALTYMESVVPIDLDARPPLEIVALRAATPDGRLGPILLGPGAAAPALDAIDGADAPSSWDELCPFDVDGDGDVDLAGVRFAPFGAPEATLSATVLENSSGRLRRVDAPFSLGDDAFESRGSVVADLDADGRVDLVLALDGGLRLYRGGPDGLAFVDGAFPPPPAGLRWQAPLVADVDADGALDVLVWAATPGDRVPGLAGTFVLRAPDGLRFALESAWAWPGPPSPCPDDAHPQATLPLGFGQGAVADVDLDGDLDLVLTSPSELCPSPALWAESGQIGSAVPYLAVHVMGTEHPLRQTSTLADDLDADGDVDLVSHAWFNGQRTRVYRNNTRENAGTAADQRGGFVRVRVRNRLGYVPYGARVELDLDGPPGAPDYAPGPGRLAVRVTGGGASNAHGDGTVSFGVGEAAGPFGVRVWGPDGPLERRDVQRDAEVELGP